MASGLNGRTVTIGGDTRQDTHRNAHQLWASIPAELGAKLRPLAGRIVRDAIREIQRAVPAYAQPLEGKFGQVLVDGVERAVFQCYDNIDNPHAPQSDWIELFRYMGRIEFLEGRNMDALQTAVRIGARVAWRHVASAGLALGVPAETQFATAEAIFAWVDELSRVAIEGYTEAQARAGGALERRRRQLLKLIVADPPGAPQAIADLAAATDWRLPDRLAVIALEYREDQHQLPATALGPEVLVDLESGEPCLVLAEPERHLRRLDKELRGRRAAIGPDVPPTEAHRSLRCARRTLGLVQRGVLPDRPITWCRDHLDTLVLLSDEFLLAQLTDRALAPLDALRPKPRGRLTATLLAWLETGGGLGEIAARLDVHPQTVRYRMSQLRTLFGDRLTDPQHRLMIEIALRSRLLLGADRLDGREDADESGPRRA